MGRNSALVLMLTNLLLLLPAASVVCGNIDQGLLEAADGEIAMKNLEAAQVKMEEKLNSLTSFIDQELEKEKDSPMSKGYARRKRETQESNPLLDLPQNTVKEMIVSMKALNSAFDNLQKAYEEYKSNMAQEKVIMEEIEQPEEPVSPAEDPEEYPSAPTEDLEDYPSAPVDNAEDFPSAPVDNAEDYPSSPADNPDEYPMPADELPENTEGEPEQAGQLEDDVTEPEGEMTDDLNEQTEATADVEVDVEGPGAPEEEENMNNDKSGKGKGKGKGKRRRKGRKGKKGKGKNGNGRRF